MSTVFEAKYAGECSECGERFAEGTSVRFVLDQLVHDICPDDLDPIGEVCPRCFTEKSTSGDCGCDE